jgi:hypothetical protein
MGKIAALVETFAGRGGRTITETETRRYDRPAALAVTTENGAVTVAGEDRDDVALEVTWRADETAAIERSRLAETGGGDAPLSLRAQTADGDDVVADLSLRVPEGLPVDAVTTANGRVDLRATGGDATVETANGRVTVADHAGDLQVDTANGRVDVERVQGFVDLSSTNGRVEARDVGGLDGARTVNGRVDVDAPALRGDVDVTTQTGSVTLRLGPDIDATLECTTNLGSIDAPVVDAASSGLGSLSATGTLGDGTHALTVESRLGSVTVTAMEDPTAPPR